MTNDEKIEIYENLKSIAHQVEDLHNTLDIWLDKLLNNIEWKDEDQ